MAIRELFDLLDRPFGHPSVQAALRDVFTSMVTGNGIRPAQWYLDSYRSWQHVMSVHPEIASRTMGRHTLREVIAAWMAVHETFGPIRSSKEWLVIVVSVLEGGVEAAVALIDEIVAELTLEKLESTRPNPGCAMR